VVLSHVNCYAHAYIFAKQDTGRIITEERITLVLHYTSGNQPCLKIDLLGICRSGLVLVTDI